jgi:hypothetical protein
MGKIVSNIIKGAGQIVGGLFGGAEVPQAPALPPPPPPTPIAPEQAIKASTSDELKKKLNDRRRVSRKSTMQTGARGVTTEAPIEYATLLGGSTTKNR